MKKTVLSIFVVFILTISVKSQVILNEVYTDPGSGEHEFFELYNSGISATAENLDNYTIVTYYEEGSNTGFYVLDLPNQTISAKSFYVGAAAAPFNVQSQSNLTADFSWNSIPSGGALTKWEKNGGSYNSVSVPANLNDLFVKRTGSGAVHHIFLFKNGLLINAFIGGTNSNIIPSYIKSMPNLSVDMTGSSPDFTISFSGMSDNQVEYTNSSTGNDNGYLRLKDGKCGVWNKSSAQVQHSPGSANGSAAGTTGELTVSAYISYGSNSTDPSILNYDISAGPVDAFPVTVESYRDLGVAGQLDANDVLIDSRQITNASAGAQQVNLPNKLDQVVLVCKSPAGCYDAVVTVSNNRSPLPVKLVSFNGNLNNNKVSLQWVVAENEITDHFEVEKSIDGKDFTTAALVFGTDKPGSQNYQYAETMNADKMFYRLRMTDKSQVATYSKILMFQSAVVAANNEIRIINNPVNDRLSFSFQSKSRQQVDVKVLDMMGRVMMKQTISSNEGSNLISMQLTSAFQKGIYVVEVIAGADHYTTRFVKQ